MNLRGKRILVCGGGGFIGGHLVARLLESGAASVRAADLRPKHSWHQLRPDADNRIADLRERRDCELVCRDCDVVFQLAADMGGMGFIETHRAACMLNVLIDTNMLLAARNAGVQRYFFSSSACVYNVEKQRSTHLTPLKEEDAYPAMPEDGYGWEKLFSERMCRHFEEDFGLECRVARYHNVYGPYGTWTGGREKAPAAICRKVIDAKASGRDEIEIWGDGSQTRSFMYIDDCVEGTLKIAQGDNQEPLNLGSAEMVTIDELVTIVERIAGVRLERRYNLNAPRGVNGRNSDNSRLKACFDWEPSIRLVDGIRSTYQWVEREMGKAGSGALEVQYAGV
jgi:nucleoside-diphosphate-sugar epimerase